MFFLIKKELYEVTYKFIEYKLDVMKILVF